MISSRFVFVKVVGNHLSVFAENSLNRLVLAYLILTLFLFTMHEIDTAADVYSEPFQTFMIELFPENS